jgi:DNA-binding HxlR family transcriptional regulator
MPQDTPKKTQLQLASDWRYGCVVTAKTSSQHRSGCPVSVSLETFGDRWSLLIVRDMMVRGFHTFRQFQCSGEGIATNILSDRLLKLENAGILTTEPVVNDGRSAHYRLTEKGIALAPVLLELLIWAGNHESTGAPAGFIAQLEQNRLDILAETYRRWEQRDPTPIIPAFHGETSPKGETKR